MTKLTKLLPPEAAPAQTILERAHDLVMTSAEREVWPETIETAEGTVTIAVEERRPLEVGECFVDEKGEFWAVRPAVEPVLRVSGSGPRAQRPGRVSSLAPRGPGVGWSAYCRRSAVRRHPPKDEGFRSDRPTIGGSGQDLGTPPVWV